MKTKTVKKGNTFAQSITNPTKASDKYYSYTFCGWSRSKDGSGQIFKTSQTLPAISNGDTYYAIWQINNSSLTAGSVSVSKIVSFVNNATIYLPGISSTSAVTTIYTKIFDYLASQHPLSATALKLLPENPAYSSGLIYGQAEPPVANYTVGTSKVSDVGCELIACYNALNLVNVKTNFAKIIKYAESNAYIMNAPALASLVKDLRNYTKFGGFGTHPYKLPNIIKNFGGKIAATYNSGSSFSNAVSTNMNSRKAIYIASFWNNPNDVTEGIHTICFYTSALDNYLRALNLHTHTRAVNICSSYGNIIRTTNAFIVGYEIKKA